MIADSLVHVVDDDPAVRQALESLLRSVGHAVRAYASAADFLADRCPEVPGCLVLDVRMPGRSGLDVQAELAQAGVELPIVFITGFGDVPMSVAAMKAGAVEFLAKPFRDQDFLDAVRRAVDLDLARRTDARTLADLRRRYAALTPREQEIMARVVDGRLNKQIAADLGLSEITVKVHRGQMMHKMEARSLPDLVRFADRLSAGAAKILPGETKV